MARCNACGRILPEYCRSCPGCGSVSITPGTAYQGAPPPAPMPYANYQPPVTSAGEWFGWTLLCSILPLIGAIIMYHTTNDPSAKNFAKLMIILHGITIGSSLFLVFLIIGLAS